MTRQSDKIAELIHLFRIIQLIHEVDSIDKIYRMLISFCTCGRIIGCRRAILFTIDNPHRLLRGTFGLERAAGAGKGNGNRVSFEEMAREVFDGFEQVESTDLTIHAKTFNVPLDWHRSALVKAVRTSYPVFAEGRLSEFATDPYFSFFNTSEYVALPLRTVDIGGGDEPPESDGSVTAVLAADGSKEGDKIGVERISLLYSLVQQAALAIHNLRVSAESDRRLRVLLRLSESIREANGRAQIDEALKQGMSQICRALDGSGSMLKDFGVRKTLFIKTVHSCTLDSGMNDERIADTFDRILERAAGTMEPIQGDAAHPLLNSDDRVTRFVAYPLVANGDVLGAFAVYTQRSDANKLVSQVSARDMQFLAIAADLLASAIDSKCREERLRRSEEMLEELRSNIVRERRKSRLGEQGIAYSELVREELGRITSIIDSGEDGTTALPELFSNLQRIRERTDSYLEHARATRSPLRSIDLFETVNSVVMKWRSEIEARGIDVEVKIPSPGPRLLMDRDKITLALDNIMNSLGSTLAEGDAALVECSTGEDGVRIVIADTGRGLPGDVLSRLFMPFRDIKLEDERKNALSLAGEIISRHGGEIVMKTSLSWKTILVLTFKEASNRDRRRGNRDRRGKTGDRRASVKQ